MSVGSTLDQAAAAIAAAPSLALACHHTPDGDALGSVLALHHLALANGKQSVASWPEPFPVAPHYEFLPGLDLATKPADFPAEPDLMVTFDCGSIGRLAELGEPARRRPRAHRRRPPQHQRRLRHDQPDRPRRRRLRRGRAPAARPAGLGPDPRGGRVPLHRPDLRHRPVPVRLHHAPRSSPWPRSWPAFDLPIASMNRQLFEEHRLAYLRLAGMALQRAVLRRRPPLRGHVGHRRRPGRVRRGPRRDRGPHRPAAAHHRGRRLLRAQGDARRGQGVAAGRHRASTWASWPSPSAAAATRRRRGSCRRCRCAELLEAIRQALPVVAT